MLAGLGRQRVILGLPWLRDKNSHIDWKAGTIQLCEGYMKFRVNYPELNKIFAGCLSQ